MHLEYTPIMFPATTNLLLDAHNNQDNWPALRPKDDTSGIITIGPHSEKTLSEEDLNLMGATTTAALETFFVIADSISWTKERDILLKEWLPSSVTRYEIIVVDRKRHCKVRKTYYYENDLPESVASSIAVPVDEVDEELSESIIQLPCLRELVIRDPHRPSFVQRDITFLTKTLTSFETLEVACISLCDGDNIEKILLSLQKHPQLTRLALFISPSFHFDAVRGESFDNAIIGGLKTLTQLEHIVVTNTIISTLLIETIGQLPRLKSFRIMAEPAITEEAIIRDLWEES